MSYEPCEELSKRNDGAEACCLHDLPDNHPLAPGRVCCWCGEIYLPHSDSTVHGEYKPKLTAGGAA